ncbi:unnamed protein product [Rotaria socialis]
MMLKFVILLVIGFFRIFHAHNHLAKADTVFSRAQAIDANAIIDRSATTAQSSPTVLFTELSTEESVTSTDTTDNVDITDRPFPPMFECDFTTPCFAENQLDRTDGSQFNLDPNNQGTTSTIQPTAAATEAPSPNKSRVGLILGLIFGLGLPTIALIGGVVYWKRKSQDRSGKYDISFTAGSQNEVSHVSRN